MYFYRHWSMTGFEPMMTGTYVTLPVVLAIRPPSRDILADYTNHFSGVYVRNNLSQPNCFSFTTASPGDVCGIKKLNTKKATGCDHIPPKVPNVLPVFIGFYKGYCNGQNKTKHDTTDLLVFY